MQTGIGVRRRPRRKTESRGPDEEEPIDDYRRKGRESTSWRSRERESERERRKRKEERKKNGEGARRREEVSDPHGNRIKTLGKRNFSCGKGAGGRGGSVVRLIRRVWKSAKEIQERRTASWRFPPQLATTTCHASRSISTNCAAG